jgi:chromosome condensin MukBEF MukE localization factor
VNALRAALPRVATLREAAIEAPPRVQLRRREFDRFIENLSGWIQLTMEAIARIPADIFTMDEVCAASAEMVANRYPDNRHVREKLRQQLQRLRDLGLIAFLGGGRYEKLVRRGS